LYANHTRKRRRAWQGVVVVIVVVVVGRRVEWPADLGKPGALAGYAPGIVDGGGNAPLRLTRHGQSA
jgi:hypothetical protein